MLGPSPQRADRPPSEIGWRCWGTLLGLWGEKGRYVEKREVGEKQIKKKKKKNGARGGQESGGRKLKLKQNSETKIMWICKNSSRSLPSCLGSLGPG